MSDAWESIDGETQVDPSYLKIKSIKTRNDLSRYEAENIRKAIAKYLVARPSSRLAPFNYSWLLKLHGEMFCDVWEWAGQARKVDLTLGISWHKIGEQLGGLVLSIEEFAADQGQLLDQAVTIHYQAVRIHPFHNGNGRWSRLLTNIWLRQHGKSPINWPEAEVGQQASSIRQEYIAAIKAADNYEFEALTELHRRYWPDA